MKNTREHHPLRWKRSVLGAAVATAVAGFAPSALAAERVIGTAQTDPQTLTGTETLVVTAAGSLIVESAVPLSVDGSATGVTISNSGTVRSDGSAAIAVAAGATGTVITNHAGADIGATGNHSAIHFGGDLDGTLSNAGTIESTGDSEAVGVRVGGALTGALNNQAGGEILATVDAGALGVAGGVGVESSLDGTLTNAGTITATASAELGSGSGGAEAYGIFA